MEGMTMSTLHGVGVAVLADACARVSPLTRTVKRPSCGNRRSAMSIPEINFTREATAG